MRLTVKCNDEIGYGYKEYSSEGSVAITRKLGQLEDILDGHSIKTLEELDGLLWYVKQIKNIEEEFNINDINELRTCLENERKGTEYFESWWNKRFEELLKPKVEALKIIKEKEVDIWALKYCSSLKQYNCKEDGRATLTQEEYDLLRKELL